MEQRGCIWHVRTWVFEGRFEGGVRYDATAVLLLVFWKRPLDKQMRGEVASYLPDKRTGGTLRLSETREEWGTKPNSSSPHPQLQCSCTWTHREEHT